MKEKKKGKGGLIAAIIILVVVFLLLMCCCGVCFIACAIGLPLAGYSDENTSGTLDTSEEVPSEEAVESTETVVSSDWPENQGITYLPYEDSTYIFCGGEYVERTDSSLGRLFGYSFKGDCAITSTHCIKSGHVIELENRGENTSTIHAMAAYGDSVAYHTTNKELAILNTNTEEIEIIKPGSENYAAVLSPDGKTLLYADDKIVYVHENGESIRIYEAGEGMGVRVISVSNHAEYMFIESYKEGNMYKPTIHLVNKNGDVIYEYNICPRTGGDYRGYFTNNNNTQLGFFDYSDENCRMIVYDAKSGEEIGTNMGEECFPIAEWMYCPYTMSDMYKADKIPLARVKNYNVDDLNYCYYAYSYGSLYRVEKGQTERISEAAKVVFPYSENGVVYSEQDKLIMYNEDEMSTLVEADVKSFAVASDRQTIYYGTNAKELYRYSDDEKERIAQNVKVEGIGLLPCIVGSNNVFWSEEETGNVYLQDATGKITLLENGGYAYSIMSYNWINETVTKSSGGSYRIIFTTENIPYEKDGKLYLLKSNGESVLISADD